MAIGMAEIIVVLVIVLLLLGPKKLPELAKAMGEAVREFKKSMSSEKAPDKKVRKG